MVVDNVEAWLDFAITGFWTDQAALSEIGIILNYGHDNGGSVSLLGQSHVSLNVST